MAIIVYRRRQVLAPTCGIAIALSLALVVLMQYYARDRRMTGITLTRSVVSVQQASPAFTADGNAIATLARAVGRNIDTVIIYDTHNGRALATVTEADRYISDDLGGVGLQFSPDAKSLATWGRGCGIINLRGKGGHHLCNDVVTAACFSPDGKTIAALVSTRSSAEVHFWDARTGRQVKRWYGPFAADGLLRFSPDGRRVLVTALNSNTLPDHPNHRQVQIRGYPANHLIGSLRDAGVIDGAFLPTGDEIAVMTLGPRIGIWNVAARSVTWRAIQGESTYLRFNSRGSMAAIGTMHDTHTINEGSEVAVVDTRTVHIIHRIRFGAGELNMYAVVPSSDGTQIAVIGVWEANHGQDAVRILSWK